MNKTYTILAGTIPKAAKPMPPFSPTAITFLQALSQKLLHHGWSDSSATWAALGFWLRSAHLKQMASTIPVLNRRLGRGLIFHIAPANMAAVFVYSLAISLLAGNGSNIVRISPRLASQIQPVCQILQNLWNQPEFQELGQFNAIISYEHNQKLTDTFSLRCDCRVLWGGDEAIRQIRTSPLMPQAIELTFADRYSIALADSACIANCTEDELREWAHRFYNDTYEADQNACSSPRLLFWLTENPSIYEQAQRRWWLSIAAESRNYDLQAIKVSNKYTDAWSFAMTVPQLKSIQRFDNILYVYTLSSLPADITPLSGSFGQFFQYPIGSISKMTPYLGKKIQTLTTIGADPAIVRQTLLAAGIMGVDRVVPVGQALEMNIIWDGFNMIEMLSRIMN